MRGHILTAFALSALAPACVDKRAPVTAAQARDAYRVALVASDTAAVALDTAAVVHRASVLAAAQRAASLCQGSGPESAVCRRERARDAYEAGRPAADKIDAAAALQRELAEALSAYAKCTPGMVDGLCEANALADAASRAPAVKTAVDAARKVVGSEAP